MQVKKGKMHQKVPKLPAFVSIENRSLNYFLFQKVPEVSKFYFTSSLETKIDRISCFTLMVSFNNIHVNFILF